MAINLKQADSPFDFHDKTFVHIGESVSRVDARQKVTGRAIYMEDVRLAGMLYGKMLRSTRSHAKIVSIDTSEAEKLPGGLCQTNAS